MKSICWTTILILFLSLTALAQPEIQNFHTYGGWFIDECYDHIQTSDGGYALVGMTRSLHENIHSSDIWIMKTDENGDSLWSSYFGWEVETYGDTWDYGWQLVETNENELLIFGSVDWHIGEPDSSVGKIVILSLDVNGDSLWTKFFGSELRDITHSVIATDDGGYAVAGYTTFQGSARRDCFLLRLDENCDSLWMQSYGARWIDECFQVIQTANGGFALAGRSNAFREGRWSYVTIFTDENGDSLWSYIAESGDRDDDHGFTINEIMHDGEPLYIMSGAKDRANRGDYDMWTIAINDNGVRQWERLDGINEPWTDENARTSTVTAEGDLVFSGFFTDRIAILKISPSGELVYEKYWDLEEWENIERLYCYSILQNAEYGLSLAGYCGKYEYFNERRFFYSDFFLLNTEPEPQGISSGQSKGAFFPSACQLYPAFPNPFNDTVTLKYSLQQGRRGDLMFFNLQGRMVDRILVSHSNNGIVTWNGSGFPNGEYFILLKSGGRTSYQSLFLLK